MPQARHPHPNSKPQKNSPDHWKYTRHENTQAEISTPVMSHALHVLVARVCEWLGGMQEAVAAILLFRSSS